MISVAEVEGAFMINGKVIDILEEIAELLEARKDNVFKIRSYRLAAKNIATLDRDLRDYYQEGRLQDIPGVGKAIADKIIEIIQTGDLVYLRRLREEIRGTQENLIKLPCGDE